MNFKLSVLDQSLARSADGAAEALKKNVKGTDFDYMKSVCPSMTFAMEIIDRYLTTLLIR